MKYEIRDIILLLVAQGLINIVYAFVILYFRG